MHARAKDNVEKRQLLVALQSDRLKAQLTQIVAMQQTAKALLTQAKANFERV